MRKFPVLMALATSLIAVPLFAAEAPKRGPVVPRKASEFVFQMVDGPQQLLSMYKGKAIVLALMYTTCPHCQKTAQLLSKIQTEYAARGVQVLGATFDQGAAGRVQQFNKSLGLNFPCGYSDQGAVLEFLQHPIDEPYFVPILVFIDKRGTIRSQYIGDETFLSNQEVNIRAEIEKLLKVGAAPSGAASHPAPKS
jgi:peroxiredoxin